MKTDKRPQTGREAIRWAASFLRDSGLPPDDVWEEGRILLSYASKKDSLQILTALDEELEYKIWEIFAGLVERRSKHEPLQYITQGQEFMSLPFYVDSAVLVPRWDTEILVEEGIRLLQGKMNSQILDLGTGSGAIAVSLAYHLACAKVDAVDISKGALKVAKKNARKNKVDDRITFYEGDMFYAIPEGKKYDVILSNPPYIVDEEMLELPRDVRKEPHIALAGGVDGLDYYRCIAEKADEYLACQGYLLLEIGFNQGVAVKKILEKNFWQEIKIIQDLGGRDRVVKALKK